MKRTIITAIAAVTLLALTGCAESAGNVTAERSTVASSSPAIPSETPEPLVADSPDAPAAEEVDAQFLELVRGELLPGSGIKNATDQQLIAAGHDGCEQVKAGVALEDIRLVEGEKATSTGYYMDTSAIFLGAQQVYCPDTIQKIG
jgi:hypothetical protein